MIPADLRYHKEHEWVRVSGTQATVGISHFAQDALGDIVFPGSSESRRQCKSGTADGRSRVNEDDLHALHAGQRNDRQGQHGFEGSSGGRQLRPLRQGMDRCHRSRQCRRSGPADDRGAVRTVSRLSKTLIRRMSDSPESCLSALNLRFH
jgi:hypothetical protein